MKAVGTTRAATNMAAMATSSAASTASRSGEIVFVSQAYPVQAHQSVLRSSTPRASPCHVGLSAR